MLSGQQTLPITDIRSLSADGTRPATAHALQEDFSRCVMGGKACPHATALHYEGIDTVLLGCRHHHALVTSTQAAVCTYTAPEAK